jgi:hypothetical protein
MLIDGRSDGSRNEDLEKPRTVFTFLLCASRTSRKKGGQEYMRRRCHVIKAVAI